MQLTSGTLLKCSDEATQQFIQFLNVEAKGKKSPFIKQKLDSTNLFIDPSKESVENIKKRIDEFSDSNAYVRAPVETNRDNEH